MPLDEPIIGQLLVSTALAMGSEELKLFITSRRLIVARKGKRGAGALAGASLLGRFSEALEELVRGGRESLKKRTPGKISAESILAAHKDNFEILYDDIIRVELTETPTGAGMTVLTKDDKLVFQVHGKLGRVTNLLQNNLGSKVEFLAPAGPRNLS